jgi:hypothetical protein
MAQKGKRRANAKLLTALACGASAEAAAREAGVSESTVYRRLADPDFCRQLQEMQAGLHRRTAAALMASGGEAVRVLRELMKPQNPPATRLGATRTVLEIGMKAWEFTELEKRLAALEEQAERTSGSGDGQESGSWRGRAAG